MKQTLTTSQAASMLASDNNNNFTFAGAYALIEYLEELETDSGEEIEFDAVAFRCDYSEYESLQDAAEDHGWKPDPHVAEDGQECDADALQWLESRATVIEFDGGVIVSQF